MGESSPYAVYLLLVVWIVVHGQVLPHDSEERRASTGNGFHGTCFKVAATLLPIIFASRQGPRTVICVATLQTGA